MISSAVLSGRVPAKPPARPGRAGRAAAAPNSSKARAGVWSTGRALHGTDPTHL